MWATLAYALFALSVGVVMSRNARRKLAESLDGSSQVKALAAASLKGGSEQHLGMSLLLFICFGVLFVLRELLP